MQPESPETGGDAQLGGSLAAAARAHEGLLWGLCYRMTGVAADADELVQETWLRCLERPPADLERPLKPWLVRVATNLARDHLRHRQSRAYIGPWLPSPVPLEQALSGEALDPERRLALAQSASMGMLLALEQLTPGQRAVWLLREVYELSVAETAEVLELSPGAVKVGLHRARKALGDAPTTTPRWTPDDRALAEQQLLRLLSALQRGEPAAAMTVLDEAARLHSDGGGVFQAARVPVEGATRIVRLYLGLLRTRAAPESVGLTELNGGPAVLLRFEAAPGQAPLVALLPELGRGGRIHALYSVLAPQKLTAVASSPRLLAP